VSGVTVALAMTGTGNTITQPVGTTNASGVATGTVSSTKAEAKTISATLNGTIAVTQTAALTVTAGTAVSLSVTGIANPSTVGTPTNVVVTALDQFGNVATGYLGTVHFTSTDLLATLPTDYTFVAGDNGTHTFTNGVTFGTGAGTTQTVTATDTVTGTITGGQTVTVN